ncbi:HAD-IA family hydrolase [Microbacterium sp. 13-71-7]|jgi:putative hydrolase of the HAD superfamily|uniref:HAD-IA family hydrolase n=1 Tax=Microbacterium sp. 13-71-7 TaxID=1970399 RepID=UPI0025CE6B8B|nr:HAD-IA family hydrolase [Microbacterium sp. 13-71-7]
MTRNKPWILFDIGGVLEIVDDGPWQEELKNRWAARAAMSRAEYDLVIAAADLPRIDLVQGRAEEYWDGFARALDFTPDEIAEARAELWDAYCGEANTMLIDYARTLHGRAGVAILSNSADGAREEEERRYGFSSVFDPICYSHEIGANKPDPEAYAAALAAMRAEPADVFFIDDRRQQIDGAARLGIRGIVHRDNATTIAAVEDFLTAAIGQ